MVVAAKERRPRLVPQPGGLTTSPTGYVRETYRETSITEFWLKDAQGKWTQVSQATWDTAEIGKPVEVCR
jgi:hypothetical protein